MSTQETTDKVKATWDQRTFPSTINGVQLNAKVTDKGFVGLYGLDGKYLFGMGYDAAILILGPHHEAINAAEGYRAQTKIDKGLAKDIAKHLAKNPQLLKQFMAQQVK